MSTVDALKVNDNRTTKVALQEETHTLAKRYVEQENSRNPLYRVSLQGVVNAAVHAYCSERLESSTETA